MIIRAIGRASARLLTQRTGAPAGVLGTFGSIDVLQLTSPELRETFGIMLGELDAITPFELAAALDRFDKRRTAARIRKDRLVRLIEERKFLLPCFVGYQEVPGQGLLPFMTDGAPGKWSLFFEPDGRITLVEADGGRLQVTSDSSQDREPAATVLAKAKSFLSTGLGTARKMLVGGDPQLANG